MGFEDVYASLQQLFPQIDARALRAVSIEHSKDVDAAVVAVIEEIIPFFVQRSAKNSPLSRSVSLSESSEGSSSVRTQALAQLQNDDSVGGKPTAPFYDLCCNVEENIAELAISGETLMDGMKIKPYSQGESLVLIDENRMENHQIEISAGPQTEGTVSADICPETGTDISCHSIIPQSTVGMLQDLDTGDSPKMDCIQEKEDIADMLPHDISVHTPGSSTQLVETPDMHESNFDKSELSLSADTATSGKNIISILGTEDKSTLKATMSSQICITDAIDEVLADARNNKKTLFLEMESVINLMKQVEAKELAAEQAKTEAATGGMDLLDQVEHLKRMLQRAKEANNMHTGEVYGEKAILATELKELRTRACSLSDERDVSVTLLNEMRQSLEIRLSSAANEIKSAELRKLEKEEAARKSLAEQELIMEKVVQESISLRQQAEDNAKLEEFLLDRGRVVDTLQGEIGVICQDVKLLKERFDQHVPLSKSLLSSQTSFMLASLASSLKNVVPDKVGDVDHMETENHEKVPEVEAATGNCKAAHQVDGWEVLDFSEVDAMRNI